MHSGLALEVIDQTGQEQLLGEDKPKRVLSPAGCMRQLFYRASKLPRGKQEKIPAILEPFIREHAGS